MFCDLVGSTALSARMDPEDLREVIFLLSEARRRDCAALCGFVAKYMGDGVLVYFGYPQAHEDDAERAVRAGLELIQAVGTQRRKAGSDGSMQAAACGGLCRQRSAKISMTSCANRGPMTIILSQHQSPNDEGLVRKNFENNPMQGSVAAIAVASRGQSSAIVYLVVYPAQQHGRGISG